MRPKLRFSALIYFMIRDDDNEATSKKLYAMPFQNGAYALLLFKGALSPYSVILCRFFAVENGGKETRGRGAGQRGEGLCHTFFFFTSFELRDQSTSGADSICPKRARSAGSRTALAPLQFRKMGCQNERKNAGSDQISSHLLRYQA